MAHRLAWWSARVLKLQPLPVPGRTINREAPLIDFDDAMTFAHAALQACAAWYRKGAAMLFCRAYDAVALEHEARAATEAGGVH
jgi:hypothetical protein